MGKIGPSHLLNEHGDLSFFIEVFETLLGGELSTFMESSRVLIKKSCINSIFFVIKPLLEAFSRGRNLKSQQLPVIFVFEKSSVREIE